MFSFLSKKDKGLPEPSEQYLKLRNSLFTSTPEQLGIKPSGKNPDVWGILIDENFGKYIQSLRVTADSQIEIFQFDGKSRIREDPKMEELIRKLLFHAERYYPSLTPTSTCPLPSSDNIRFSIFTFTGIYTAEVEVKELATSGENHYLTNLNNAYHEILFLNKWGKTQSPIDTNILKWHLLVREDTKIFREPDVNSTPIIELKPGEEIEIGAIKNAEWLTVSIPDGQWGYMPGNASIIGGFEQWTLLQKEATVYSKPSSNSSTVTKLKKGDIFYTIPSIKPEDKAWIKIRVSVGNEGFIGEGTRGKKIEQG